MTSDSRGSRGEVGETEVGQGGGSERGIYDRKGFRGDISRWGAA
jgi:hypothetical protein